MTPRSPRSSSRPAGRLELIPHQWKVIQHVPSHFRLSAPVIWIRDSAPPLATTRHRCQAGHCGDLPGPPELNVINPDAVHDHGQPTRQRHDRLLHSAMLGVPLRTDIVAKVFLHR